MTEITARGFAVVTDGKIDVRTVCPHIRGAVVNWLVTTGGIDLTNDVPDERIFAFWDSLRHQAQVLPVKVTVVLSAADE